MRFWRCMTLVWRKSNVLVLNQPSVDRSDIYSIWIFRYVVVGSEERGKWMMTAVITPVNKCQYRLLTFSDRSPREMSTVCVLRFRILFSFYCTQSTSSTLILILIILWIATIYHLQKYIFCGKMSLSTLAAHPDGWVSHCLGISRLVQLVKVYLIFPLQSAYLE